MSIYGGGYSDQSQYYAQQNSDPANPAGQQGLDDSSITQQIKDVGYEDYQAELMTRQMRREFGDQPITEPQVQEFASNSDHIQDAAQFEAGQHFQGNASGRMNKDQLQGQGMPQSDCQTVTGEYGDGQSVDQQGLASAIANGDAGSNGQGQFTPAPAAGGSAPAPAAGGSAPAPAAGGSAPAPAAGGSAPAPAAGGSAPAAGAASGAGSSVPAADGSASAAAGTAPVSGAAPVGDGSYPAGATSIELTNDKDYGITLVAKPNPDSPGIANIDIPAGQTVTVDVAELSGTAQWAGAFEIVASDTMESTGALLEYNYNANWGQAENVNFFDLSYIKGIPYNSQQQDIINTVAYLPNGIVQGNQNGDMNSTIGQYWDQLYDPSTGLMKPLQNGDSLIQQDTSGNNLMANLLLDYRAQTDSAFYLYVGTEVSNFADDQFSQGWSGDQGMKVTFY